MGWIKGFGNPPEFLLLIFGRRIWSGPENVFFCRSVFVYFSDFVGTVRFLLYGNYIDHATNLEDHPNLVSG